MCDMKYAPLVIYRYVMYKLVWKSEYKIVSSSTEISLLMHHSCSRSEMKPQVKTRKVRIITLSVRRVVTELYQ
jgi:hypothetical protein